MVEIIQSAQFVKWLRGMKDRKAKSIILDRLLRFQEGNLGDIKSVGEGVSEARIHYGSGYRLYFVQKGNTLIIMLGGGDKSSQKKDINVAKQLASEWK